MLCQAVLWTQAGIQKGLCCSSSWGTLSTWDRGRVQVKLFIEQFSSKFPPHVLKMLRADSKEGVAEAKAAMTKALKVYEACGLLLPHSLLAREA